MKRKLLALADKEFLYGNHTKAIEVIEAFYTLTDAEEHAEKLLRQYETVRVGASSPHSKNQPSRVIADLEGSKTL